MVLTGIFLIGSAAGLVGAIGAFAQTHPSILAFIGSTVFVGGAFAALARLAGQRLSLRAANRDSSLQAIRAWPSLSRQQISDLRNRLATSPVMIEGHDNRKIQIARNEFQDCADLADDLREAFQGAGWDVSGPGRLWGDIPNGIWIGGPQNDPRVATLLSILSKVLGIEYEPMAVETIQMPPHLDPLKEGMIPRVAIGRRPRRD